MAACGRDAIILRRLGAVDGGSIDHPLSAKIADRVIGMRWHFVFGGCFVKIISHQMFGKGENRIRMALRRRPPVPIHRHDVVLLAAAEPLIALIKHSADPVLRCGITRLGIAKRVAGRPRQGRAKPAVKHPQFKAQHPKHP